MGANMQGANISGKIDISGTISGSIQIGGGGSANLQDSVTVKSTREAQTVLPDSGYDGFKQVNVEALNLQSKTAELSTLSSRTITPDTGYDGLSRVTVPQVRLQTKYNVEPSDLPQRITADSGYTGLAAVNVNAIALQSKTVTPSSQLQVISADEGYAGLDEVYVNAASDGNAIIQATVIPTGVFENAGISKMTLPLCDRIEPGSMSGINGNSHFDLYLTNASYVAPADAQGVAGYPFGTKTDVTVHVKASVESFYSSSPWEEFIYEHEGFQLSFDL